MSDEKKTKAQIAAEKKRADLSKNVSKALGKKKQTMRQLAAKLGLASDDGSVKPSVATKIRTAIDGLGSAVIREGNRSSMTYRKA